MPVACCKRLWTKTGGCLGLLPAESSQGSWPATACKRLWLCHATLNAAGQAKQEICVQPSEITWHSCWVPTPSLQLQLAPRADLREAMQAAGAPLEAAWLQRGELAKAALAMIKGQICPWQQQCHTRKATCLAAGHAALLQGTVGCDPSPCLRKGH